MNLERSVFDRDSKINAVRQVIEDGHCPFSIAAGLQIKSDQLHRWIRRYAIPSEHSPGRMRLKTAVDELWELRCVVETLKREQEQYKKILAGV